MRCVSFCAEVSGEIGQIKISSELVWTVCVVLSQFYTNQKGEIILN